MSISKFWEIVRAYHKKHIYLWLLGVIVLGFALCMTNIIFLLPLLGLYAVLSIGKDIHFGWTDKKIHNLLLYKQLTQNSLTPLENEAVQNYFGKHERKQLILSGDRRKAVTHQVYMIDTGAIVCLILGVMIITPSFFATNPNSDNLTKTYGCVIGLEYHYAKGLFGTATNSVVTTIVYLNNDSIELLGKIELKIGKYYTISFYSSGKCESLKIDNAND